MGYEVTRHTMRLGVKPGYIFVVLLLLAAVARASGGRSTAEEEGLCACAPLSVTYGSSNARLSNSDQRLNWPLLVESQEKTAYRVEH